MLKDLSGMKACVSKTNNKPETTNTKIKTSN
jgi:hypothetical protein